MADVTAIIRNRLSALIEARGEKPTPLSKRAGLSESFLRDFLSGKSGSPTLASIEKVCAALGTTVEELLSQPGSKEDLRIARLMSLLSPEQRRQLIDYAEWQAAGSALQTKEFPTE